MIQIRIEETLQDQVTHGQAVQQMVNDGYEIVSHQVVMVPVLIDDDEAYQYLYSTMLRRAPHREPLNLASVVEVQGLKVEALRSLVGGLETQIEVLKRHLRLTEPTIDHPTDLHTLPGLSRLELVLEEIEADKAAGR